ncbi:MAG: ATP-binding protein, partial [Myxococcales bacterium]|nr:ATP-binding protein [Myxococcales bacterium]
GDHLGGVAVNLHRAGLESVVASRLPLSVAGSTVFTRALYSELLGGPCSLEQAFVGARQALMRVSDARDWASVQLYARPGGGDDTRPLVLRPYRGLLPFRAIDTRLFYGREAERREIVADLEALREAGRPRLLVIAGASGTGKSSLVHAGAIPDLMGEQGDEDDASEDVDHLRRAALHHVESLVRVTGDEGFARALAELRQPARAPLRVTGAWVTITIRPGAAPVETLERALAAHVDTGRALLLVVDQFEELFTQTTSADQRGRFARRLWSLAQGDDLVHVVLTIRVDFLGRCGELVLDDAGARLDRVAYDEAHRVFIAQMQPAQLQTAIEAPAERVGLRLQQGLARRMLADVGGEPGALPLLQYTLFLLWQRRRGRTLELATYEALGGVVGALERRADELLDALDEREARQARRLFVNLVAVTDTHTLDTRRRVALRDLRAREPGAEDAFDQVVARFVDARLLVRGEERDEPIVEVAHEALLRRWTRLRGWLMEDRDKLAALREVESWAAPWPKHKPLLAGDQLAIAVSVRDRYPHDVSAKVHEMVDASARAEEARARRQRRRGRVVLLSIAAFAVMMAASTALIYRWYRNAQELERAEGVARGRAELAREDTLDALYLGTARLFAEDATEMAAWLREVKRPAKLRGWVALANDALQQPIAREVLTPGAREVQVSDDLDRLLSRGASGRFAAVVQGDGSTRVWPLPGLAEDDRLALSRDGGRVLITPRRGDELVSVLLDAERRARLPEVDTSTALRHPDGVRVLVRARGRDDEWLVWDSERGEITRRLEVPAPSRWARFLEGGARALAVSDAGYTIWSIEQDAPPLRVPGRPCAAGDRLVIVSVVEQGRETALVHRVTPDADVSAPVARDSDRAPVVSCAVLDDAHEHVLVTRADGRAQLRPVSELGGFTRTLAGAPKSFAPFARLIDSKLVLGSVALARVKGEDPSLYELRLYDLSRGASLSQPVEERVLECSARPFALEGAIVCPGDDTVALWRVRDRATRVERLPGHLLDRRDGALLDLVVSDGNHATLYASRFPPGVPGVPLHAGGPPRSIASPVGAAQVVTSSTAALRVWPDTGVSALSLRRSSACPLRSLVFSQEAPARLWVGGCPGEPVTRWSVETGAAERDTSFAARLSPRGDWTLDLTV